MKVKVLRTFSDKQKGCINKVGDIIELTKKRYEEINSTSFGQLVQEIEKER